MRLKGQKQSSLAQTQMDSLFSQKVNTQKQNNRRNRLLSQDESELADDHSKTIKSLKTVRSNKSATGVQKQLKTAITKKEKPKIEKIPKRKRLKSFEEPSKPDGE